MYDLRDFEVIYLKLYVLFIMKRLKILLTILVVIVVCVFFWWQNGLQPVNTQDRTQETFVVKPGTGLRDIASNLKQAGLIRDPIVFFLEVKKLGLDGRIQAGNFRLSPSMSTDSIIKDMTHGTLDVWVTIPEGKRAEEVDAIFKDKLTSYNDSWLPALKAHEGYLFPDTYSFPKDADITAVINVMTNNFQQKYEVAKEQATTNLSEQDAVILASILEREGKSGQDMKEVASVLENRLSIGMPLQVDASIQYALGYQQGEQTWWKKALTADDLKIVSPYNTYTNPGLPPTPISNPGLEALEAVLNPAKTNYLYYVSDKNGTLHFATTLDQQNTNIRKYE